MRFTSISVRNSLTSLFAILVAPIALLLSSNAAAQGTAEEVIEEIVVSAKFQRSLASAILQKRAADNQIEAIGLEDIGVLPAVSIADAIATLPGIAGARTDDGAIGELSVRGTTDLAIGLLNGREQVTISTTRNVEYGLYPPNVMTSVQVHKTPTATLIEGGLSGVIDMNTIKPMDFDDRNITVNAEVSNFGISDDVLGADDIGGQASIIYIDQLSDSFGFALSYAHAEESLGRDGDVAPFPWGPFTAGFGAPADVDGDGIFGEEIVPQGFTLLQEGGDEERNSFFAALQWQTDNVDVNFDLLASSRDQNLDQYGVNFIGLTSASFSLVNPVVNIRNGLDEYAEATITVPGTNASGFGSGGSSSFNQLTNVEQDVLSTGLNISYSNDDWTVAADLSHSEAESDEQIFDATTHLAPTGGFGGPTFTLTYSALGETPTLSVQEDLTDPSLWVPRQFEEVRFANEDELDAIRLDLVRALGDSSITSIKFGVRYSERDKDFARLANRFNAAFVPDDPALVLDRSFIRGIATPDNGPDYIAWDVTALQSRFTNMISQADAALPPPNAQNALLQESGSVEEENFSAYVQMDFDVQLGSVPVRGNVGVRYLDTDVVAPGWSTPDQSTVPATPIAPTHSYDEWLPSLNLSFEPSENHVLRAGIGRVMNRAPLDDMKSSQAIFISGFGANGFSGNPQLDPTVADQISVSYEWYPANATSLVLAGYYNDLDTFIGTQFVTVPIVPAGGGAPVDVLMQVPGNGSGGYIRGLELAVNSTFGFLHESLDSLGTSFSYALTESNVLPVAAAGQAVALTGLSEDVANLALWWVGNNVEARVGFDYRSEYIEPGVFGNFLHVDDTLLASFQLSYDFSEDFRVSLFGRNIGDEQRRKYTFNVPERTEFNVAFRETYGLKVFYQF